jgi:hypothetical protein
MTQVANAQPTPPGAKQKSKDPEKEEMVRAQEEAANERATEGGYQ